MCVDVRLILVLVLGRQIIYGQNTVYLCLSKYIVFLKHTAVQASCGEKHSSGKTTNKVALILKGRKVNWRRLVPDITPGTSERFVANCGVGPSTRGQGDSASLVQRR